MSMVMVVIIRAVMVTDMVLVMVMVMVIVIVMVFDMLMVMVLDMVIALVIVMDMMVVMVAVMVRVKIKVLGGFDFGCDNGSNHCGGNFHIYISGGDGCGAQTLKMSDPSSPLRVALAPRLSGRVALWGRFWRWRCEGRRPPLLFSPDSPSFLGCNAAAAHTTTVPCP